MILIQGIGCTETGGRIVLRELLLVAPPERRFLVLCTNDTAKDFIGKRQGGFAPNIYLIGLSHRIFGKWLRPLLEIAIALAALSRVIECVVNLSNYGVCFGSKYLLYIHSPLLMDLKAERGGGGGKPNILKRGMLNSCIRRAQLIVLQTQGMSRQLREYCAAMKLPLPKYRVMRPKVEIPIVKEARRSFDFQLFYPVSRFAHKRADLAIAAGQTVHARNPSIGLVITTVPVDGEEAMVKAVHQLGRISREDVYAWFNGSDAMLFTSERETLGLPLLEAMEFDLPVIAPRLPYSEELLGEAGCYFDEFTPESVADAITRCQKKYEFWKEKIKHQKAEIAKDAATWTGHWDIFLKF